MNACAHQHPTMRLTCSDDEGHDGRHEAQHSYYVSKKTGKATKANKATKATEERTDTVHWHNADVQAHDWDKLEALLDSPERAAALEERRKIDAQDLEYQARLEGIKEQRRQAAAIRAEEEEELNADDPRDDLPACESCYQTIPGMAYPDPSDGASLCGDCFDHLEIDAPAGTPDPVLISCSSMKLTTPGRHRVRDLYTSPLFRKSVQWAEAQGRPWAVLSAKHGLLKPEAEVETYNVQLAELNEQELNDWTDDVDEAMRDYFPGVESVTVLAGKRYVDALPYWIDTDLPLKHYGTGERLQWLTDEVECADFNVPSFPQADEADEADEAEEIPEHERPGICAECNEDAPDVYQINGHDCRLCPAHAPDPIRCGHPTRFTHHPTGCDVCNCAEAMKPQRPVEPPHVCADEVCNDCPEAQNNFSAPEAPAKPTLFEHVADCPCEICEAERDQLRDDEANVSAPDEPQEYDESDPDTHSVLCHCEACTLKAATEPKPCWACGGTCEPYRTPWTCRECGKTYPAVDGDDEPQAPRPRPEDVEACARALTPKTNAQLVAEIEAATPADVAAAAPAYSVPCEQSSYITDDDHGPHVLDIDQAEALQDLFAIMQNEDWN